MKLPPSRDSADSALTPEAADALLAGAQPAGVGLPIALVDAVGRAVAVTPFGLAFLGAADRADFQRRFLAGDGPGARRMRHLAATLPVADGPRLERMRRFDGVRPKGANVRCLRVVAPDGAAFLVLAADDAGFAGEAPTVFTDSGAPAPPAVSPTVEPPRRSRFLWSLDREGRFGAPDPSLAAALGTRAPKAGEAIEAACLGDGVQNGDALAAAAAKRETFSGLTVLWRAGDGARTLPITFAGAPLFDGARDFAGFRGFGTIGEPIDAATPAAPAPAPGAGETARAAEGPAIPESSSAPAVEPGREEKASERVAATREPPAADQPAQPPPESAAPPDPLGGPERTAEIYVLRHGHSPPPAPPKVVPIRPGAFDASRPQEFGDSGDGGIELSKAEREAFREIARALVGRPPSSRHDAPPPASERRAESSDAAPEALRDATAATPGDEQQKRRPEGDPAAVPVLRNALTLLDRLPLGVLVARDAQPLYVNQTLLALLGYRDLEHFESSDGLAAMFRGDGRPTLPDTDDGAFSIFTGQGEALAVEGRAQAIVWDGAPATLMMLRPARLAGHGGARPGGDGETEAGGFDDDLVEMLALATDGAVVLDSAGRIQSFNLSAQGLFGYGEREVMGESVLMLLAPQSHPAATVGLENLSRLENGIASEAPTAVVGRNRDGAPLALTLTLARVGAPDAPHYCALFRDVRREREAERRLTAARDAAHAASAAKTEFLAHVSHEIRTPLHAILGFAEVMMEERFGPIGNERYRDYLKDIHTSGRHIMSLADDLLDLSKIESGKLELAFAPVDANSLIRDCVSLMQPQAARERIIMRVSLYDRLPRVMVDERSLRQIMLNLMSNAVKFNEPGGQVIVSTAVDAAGQAVIRVRDTGVGMNESEVGVALEPFGQVGRGGRKGGVGLGLPLTKALVEANKAEFSIKSRRDHGTLVEICFPVVQAAQ